MPQSTGCDRAILHKPGTWGAVGRDRRLNSINSSRARVWSSPSTFFRGHPGWTQKGAAGRAGPCVPPPCPAVLPRLNFQSIDAGSMAQSAPLGLTPVDCPHCGQRLPFDSRVCPNCGLDLTLVSLLAERTYLNGLPHSTLAPSAPEVTIPKLGTYLLEQHQRQRTSWRCTAR
jgi:hypothetical protein